MNYKLEINNKILLIEIINEGTNILKKKKYFIEKNYTNEHLKEVQDKLTNNSLNAYFCIRKVEDKRVVFKYEELFSSKSSKELIEVLILVFEQMSEFEICEALLRIIK